MGVIGALYAETLGALRESISQPVATAVRSASIGSVGGTVAGDESLGRLLLRRRDEMSSFDSERPTRRCWGEARAKLTAGTAVPVSVALRPSLLLEWRECRHDVVNSKLGAMPL